MFISQTKTAERDSIFGYDFRLLLAFFHKKGNRDFIGFLMAKRKLLPLGFRFTPTDEELVMYYLKRKITGKEPHIDIIPELDIYKFAPWKLPGNFAIFFLLALHLCTLIFEVFLLIHGGRCSMMNTIRIQVT